MNITNYKMERIANKWSGETEPIKMDASIPFIMSVPCSFSAIELHNSFGVASQDDDGGILVSVDKDDNTLQGAYKLWLEMMKDRGFM